jgi:hypothetical protein
LVGLKGEHIEMGELVFSYLNSGLERVEAEFLTVQEFIDTMNDYDNDDVDIPMLDDEDVEAIFYGDDNDIKHFDTVDDLLTYCEELIA